MIPRTSACRGSLQHGLSPAEEVGEKHPISTRPEGLRDAVSVWKGKGEPHPPSLLSSPRHLSLSLNLRTSTRIASGGGCRGLESISGTRDCVIELHDTLARPASVRACALTHAPSPKAGPSRQDPITLASLQNGTWQIESHRNPREEERPLHPDSKTDKNSSSQSKALTDPRFSVALRVTTECPLLSPEHRPYLVNV